MTLSAFSSDINYGHFLATYADPFDLSIKIAALSKLRFPNAVLGVPFFHVNFTARRKEA